MKDRYTLLEQSPDRDTLIEHSPIYTLIKQSILIFAYYSIRAMKYLVNHRIINKQSILHFYLNNFKNNA